MQAVDAVAHRKSISEVIAEREAEIKASTENLSEVALETERRLRTELETQLAKVKTAEAPSTQSTTTTIELAQHPILGTELANLGYKRLYLTPSINLTSVPIWSKQRVYRHERSKKMAKEKLKDSRFGLPGAITLAEGRNGELSIIDGQHRVGMLAILSKISPATDVFDNILVEVYSAAENETANGSGSSDVEEVRERSSSAKIIPVASLLVCRFRMLILTGSLHRNSSRRSTKLSP